MKLKYELGSAVVDYLLRALNRTQIAGVQSAEDLLGVVKLLQNPLNAEDLEKEQYHALKSKFDKEIPVEEPPKKKK
jgi:hypothetical protein